MKYEEMTVEELRAEMRSRGLPQQKNGKRFKKAELIERLRDDDWEDTEPEKPEKVEKPGKAVQAVEKKQVENSGYAEMTLDEIEERFGGRIEKSPFLQSLIVEENMVVFVEYVEAQNHNFYKKLRTARIKEVHKEDKIAVVETFYGNVFRLPYEDILYVKTKEGWFPAVIKDYLKKQRTKNGWRDIRARYEKNDESH